MRIGIEWCVQVYKLYISPLCDLLDSLLYLILPVSCTRLEAWMLHTDRCRTCDEDTYLGVGLT